MTKISPKIFREYDICGTLKKDFAVAKTAILGRALAKFFHEIPPEEELIVARDQSPKSEAIQRTIVKELVFSGQLIVDLGPVPSPLFHYAPYALGYRCGLFIASDSKTANLTILNEGRVVNKEEIQKLAALARQSAKLWSLSSDPGRKRSESMMIPYLRMLRQKLKLSQGMKIVIHCDHRPDAFFTTYLFTSMGCEVISLASDAYQDDLKALEDKKARLKILSEVIRKEKADLGFFFPTGGERLQVIDEKGRIISSEKIMLFFLREILPMHPKSQIAVAENCPKFLLQRIKKLGGVPVTVTGGHLALQAQIQHGALFAADDTYFCFADEYFGYADAFYGAGRLLRQLCGQDKPLSKLLPRIRKIK